MALNQVDISMMEDIPAPGVAGKIIISDGTGWTSGENAPSGSIVKQATDPTPTDPATPSLGDMILNNTTGQLFSCTDATAGVAVWIETVVGDTINASLLNGALPALDGSQLTNLPASGKVIMESTSDPAITTNPATGVSTLYLRTDTGDMWCCTDATTDNNAWMSVGEGVTRNIKPGYMTTSFMVLAGGGGNGYQGMTGGAGGGGLRTSHPGGSGGGGPSESNISLSLGTTYTITVGAGGVGQAASPHGANYGQGGIMMGQNSSITGADITDIVSDGGGSGGVGNHPGVYLAQDGGCGGGEAQNGNGGVAASGTTNQGYDGQICAAYNSGGGGQAGGGGTAGSPAAPGSSARATGGVGKQVNIDGNNYYWGGGGGGGDHNQGGVLNGGIGGGGAGRNYSGGGTGGTSAINAGGNYGTGTFSAGGNGGTNSGGGAGGSHDASAGGASGGSGIVFIKIPTANYTGTVSGSPTVSTSGSDTLLKFTGTGSYTA